MTSAEFRARFPEFIPTEDSMVEAQLAAAELQVSDTWGDDEREEIIALRAASFLAASPIGRAAKLSSDDGESTYDKRLQELYRAHACALNRLG